MYLFIIQAFSTLSPISVCLPPMKRRTMTKPISTKAGKASRIIWRILHRAQGTCDLSQHCRLALSLHSKNSLGKGKANKEEQPGQGERLCSAFGNDFTCTNCPISPTNKRIQSNRCGRTGLL